MALAALGKKPLKWRHIRAAWLSPWPRQQKRGLFHGASCLWTARFRRRWPSLAPPQRPGQQFPPSDRDCHTPLPCARCVTATIPRH